MAKTIKKLKLSELQVYKLRHAHHVVGDVLREVSANTTLVSDALSDRQVMHEIVVNLECVLIGK